MITRGVCNNNPFNVVRGTSRWLGLVPPYRQTDSRFCQFIDLKYGVRCGIILLRKYIQTYGLCDVSSIIYRFAPASENDTAAYIKFLTDYLESYGFTPDDIRYKSDKFVRLCLGIMKFESQLVLSPAYVRSVIKIFQL